MVTTGTETSTGRDAAAYLALQRSPAFARLRSRSRRYLAGMAALFLAAFVATALAVGWMPGSVALPMVGQVSLGLLFAVGLVVLPAVVCAVHLRYAGRRLDPLAERVREEFERGRR